MDQPSWLKRMLFALYVLWHKGPTAPTPMTVSPTFIWKDVYFLLWHIFFWKLGRALLGQVTAVRPLLETGTDLVDTYLIDATEHARNDRDNRPLQQKIIHTTRFPVSEHTVASCCHTIAQLGRQAPWQYSVSARYKAKQHMMLLCLSAFALCVYFFQIEASPDSLTGWIRLIALISFLLGGAGWIADIALYRFALEAQRRKL